jgi:hypothetical protein
VDTVRAQAVPGPARGGWRRGGSRPRSTRSRPLPGRIAARPCA